MNISVFSGRLVADTEQKYTKSGTAVSNFTLAVDSGFGEYKRTDFPKFTLWKRENLVQHLTKGKAVSVMAEYQERKYQDKDGNNRKVSEFVVRNLEFQRGGSRGSQKTAKTDSASPQPKSESQPGPGDGWQDDSAPF